MSDATASREAPVKKKSKLPLIIGIVLALGGGGGGFFAVQQGYLSAVLGGDAKAHDEPTHTASSNLENTAFVEVPPLTITLSKPERMTHLRFRASLEVPKEYEADVTKLLPRIQNVMNSYLRALEGKDFEDPISLLRVRAQLLRRMQSVAGYDRVNDLLVLEFVLT